jgi:hypothetical protein
VVAVHDQRERIHPLTVDQHVEARRLARSKRSKA